MERGRRTGEVLGEAGRGGGARAQDGCFCLLNNSVEFDESSENRPARTGLVGHLLTCTYMYSALLKCQEWWV